MNCGKFERECRGLGEALLMIADDAKKSESSPSDPLQYDAKSAPIMASDLRNLADAIEQAAVVK
jgi:hypothetical protein